MASAVALDIRGLGSASSQCCSLSSRCAERSHGAAVLLRAGRQHLRVEVRRCVLSVRGTRFCHGLTVVIMPLERYSLTAAERSRVSAWASCSVIREVTVLLIDPHSSIGNPSAAARSARQRCRHLRGLGKPRSCDAPTNSYRQSCPRRLRRSLPDRGIAAVRGVGPPEVVGDGSGCLGCSAHKGPGVFGDGFDRTACQERAAPYSPRTGLLRLGSWRRGSGSKGSSWRARRVLVCGNCSCAARLASIRRAASPAGRFRSSSASARVSAARVRASCACRRGLIVFMPNSARRACSTPYSLTSSARRSCLCSRLTSSRSALAASIFRAASTTRGSFSAYCLACRAAHSRRVVASRGASPHLWRTRA